jgi:hypothetical protein
MNESEIKTLWQKGRANQSVTIDRENLSENESQYNKILNKVSLLHDRGFQIIMFIFCSLGIFFPPLSSPHTPQIIMISLIYVSGLWYLFFLYENLRAMIKTESIESNALIYFTRKRDIMSKVAFLQKASMIYYMLLILFLFRARFNDVGSGYRYIIMLLFIIIMGIGAVIHYRRNMLPTIIYLDNLVKHLAEENNLE